MGEFHKAWYITCPKHKDIEHPLWRKCPKCNTLIVYSEEDLRKAWNQGYNKAVSSINEDRYDQDDNAPTFDQWFEQNKKK